jgi:hypothetical protein
MTNTENRDGLIDETMRVISKYYDWGIAQPKEIVKLMYRKENSQNEPVPENTQESKQVTMSLTLKL